LNFEPASFRDPAGSVIIHESRVFRLLRKAGVEIFNDLSARGVYERLARERLIVPGNPIVEPALPVLEGEILLEHERLEIISYPYEWPFDLLKDAALFHLDLQIRLLAEDVSIIDASPYNIQFDGCRPIFIDLLSMRPYLDNQPWIAQRQFTEQFLTPLFFHAKLGIPYHDWYSGRLEGLPIEDVARLLRIRHYLSPTLLSFIIAPAALQRRHRKMQEAASQNIRLRQLPRKHFRAMLLQLRSYIQSLTCRQASTSLWADYERENTYASDEIRGKAEFVASFVGSLRKPLIVDLGCNAGLFAEIALHAGARLVIGCDADHGALAGAVRRAKDSGLRFLPLHQNLLRPSPDQGWQLAERPSLLGRLKAADGLLALALLHHLVIGGNVPLASALDQILAIAPTGVIEFVPKDDPTVRIMLAARSDIFDDYSFDAFVTLLGQRARIVRELTISASGRTLFWYETKSEP
jgi:ribosomal protein L11 methylase PrmA